MLSISRRSLYIVIWTTIVKVNQQFPRHQRLTNRWFLCQSQTCVVLCKLMHHSRFYIIQSLTKQSVIVAVLSSHPYPLHHRPPQPFSRTVQLGYFSKNITLCRTRHPVRQFKNKPICLLLSTLLIIYKLLLFTLL